MSWLWFACGMLVGFTLGLVLVCSIVINRESEEHYFNDKEDK